MDDYGDTIKPVEFASRANLAPSTVYRMIKLKLIDVKEFAKGSRVILRIPIDQLEKYLKNKDDFIN